MESEKLLGAKSENRPEIIEAAAIKFEDGRVFTGQIHAEALIAAGEGYGFHNLDRISGYIDGFVTSTGRFIDRAEAGVIAKAAQQLEHLDSKRMPNAEINLDSDDILALRKDEMSNPWGHNL